MYWVTLYRILEMDMYRNIYQDDTAFSIGNSRFWGVTWVYIFPKLSESAQDMNDMINPAMP